MATAVDFQSDEDLVEELREKVESQYYLISDFKEDMILLTTEVEVRKIDFKILQAEQCLKDLSRIINMYNEDHAIALAAQRNSDDFRYFIAQCQALRSHVNETFMKLNSLRYSIEELNFSELSVELPALPEIYSELRSFRVGLAESCDVLSEMQYFVRVSESYVSQDTVTSVINEY